jgi:hypothetical protein
VRRHRRLLAYGALVCALLVPAVAAGGRDEAGSQELFVEGDSLAVGTRPFIARELREWQITHSVKIGRHTAEGIAALREEAASLPNVIHLSLGTNDDPRRVSAFRDSIREVMDLAGPDRCVVWANIVRPRVRGTSYAGYNRALAAESGPRENLRVVNWARLVRENPRWLTADRVHATPGGYAGRARVVARSVRRCQLSDGSAGIVASSR